MSRIGKKPIEIPQGVEILIDGQKITVKGPKGQLERVVRPEIKVELKENELLCIPVKTTKNTNAFWGLTRALLANMVKGVVEGYEKSLQIEGLGYKANMEGDTLVLMAGFTHSVKIASPEGIKITVDKNIINVSGIDKELVGLTASRIKKVRPVEPYKGKGLRYVGEVVRKKAGKKVTTAAGG